MQQHLIEGHRRTAARAASYRAMSVISSFIMIGIGSGVVVEISKTVIYYLLERIWLYANWQINEGHETQLRIVTRALIYRVMATVVVTYWVGFELALWLAVVQTLLFYLNEIAWRRISWGKSVETS